MFFPLHTIPCLCLLVGLLVCACLRVHVVNVMYTIIRIQKKKHFIRCWLCQSSHVYRIVSYRIGASVILHLYMFFCSFSLSLFPFLFTDCLFWSAYQLKPLTMLSTLFWQIAMGELYTNTYTSTHTISSDVLSLALSFVQLTPHWHVIGINKNANHNRLVQFNILRWAVAVCFFFKILNFIFSRDKIFFSWNCGCLNLFP